MTSLQGRLRWATALAASIVLLGAGYVVYAAVRSAVWAEYDRALEAKARTVAADVEQRGAELELELEEYLSAKFSQPGFPEHFQVWRDDDGSVAAKSPSLRTDELPKLHSANGAPSYRFIKLPDGTPGRAATLHFQPVDAYDLDDEDRPAEPSPPVAATLVYAATTKHVDDALAALAWLLLAVAIASVATIIFLQFAVVRLGLRPLDRLAADIERLDAQCLSARLATDVGPRELAPVALKLNDLLGRLEAAFARERAFASDVAHELRTPIAGIRAQLDLALQRDRSADEYRGFLQACSAVCREMQAMIESLLAVARLDADQIQAQRVAVDLDLALRDGWIPFAERAAARKLRLNWDLAEGVTVHVDAGHLRLIIRNLLDNAVSHADEGGSIAVWSRPEAPKVVFQVRNTGSQTAARDAARVFDRLWRHDASRTQTGGHAGLGLSIVRRLLALNGGAIEIETARGGDFTATVTLAADRGQVDERSPPPLAA